MPAHTLPGVQCPRARSQECSARTHAPGSARARARSLECTHTRTRSQECSARTHAPRASACGACVTPWRASLPPRSSTSRSARTRGPFGGPLGLLRRAPRLFGHAEPRHCHSVPRPASDVNDYVTGPARRRPRLPAVLHHTAPGQQALGHPYVSASGRWASGFTSAPGRADILLHRRVREPPG